MLLTPWHWFGFGFALIAVEMLGTAGYFLWLGIAALGVAATHLVFPQINTEIQLILFAIYGIATTLSWGFWLRNKPKATPTQILNQREQTYIGRLATLHEDTQNRRSRVQLDDSLWSVECDEELPAGTSVKIHGAKGALLLAKKVTH